MIWYIAELELQKATKKRPLDQWHLMGATAASIN